MGIFNNMWIIERGATKFVYATCKEKSLLTNPSYLIKFINDLGNNVKYCIVEDVSSYPDRTQKFEIVETDTPFSNINTPTNQVKLNYLGKWKYFIYEAESFSSVDTEGLTLVEQGKLVVTTTAEIRKEYTSQQTERVQYVG